MRRLEIINGILEREGSAFTDDPADSGGPTKWGITEGLAREYGYTGDMRQLSREYAFEIYEDLFWNRLGCNEMVFMSPEIAAEVADTAVNCGPTRAITWLQRSLNVLNTGGTLYRDLVADGITGSKTLVALESYLAVRSPVVLLRALNSLQGAYYIELAERREKDERFLYGWFNHRVA